MEFAKVHQTPEHYVRNLDRMLMYLGRYGKQDAATMEVTTSTVTIRAWVTELGEFLEEERRQAER